jgi:hypothetical protein
MDMVSHAADNSIGIRGFTHPAVMNIVGSAGSKVAGSGALNRSCQSGGCEAESRDSEDGELAEGVHFDLSGC